MSRIDPKNTYYFQHYNTLFIKVVPGDSVLETKESFRYFLSSIFADRFGVYKQEGEWSNSMYYEVTVAHKEYYLRLTHEHDYFDLGKAPLEKQKKLSEENGWTYSKVFSIDEVRYNLDSIMRSGHATPNYNPKKIDRTLESVDTLNEAYFTSNEQIDEYAPNIKLTLRIGDEVKLIDNHLEIYRKYNNIAVYTDQFDFIDRFKNKIFKITGKFKGDGNLYPWWSRVEPIGMVLSNSERNNTYLLDATLVKHINAPSYTPRKIDRTLESSLLENVNDLGYFKKYNTFVCVFSRYMNPEEFKKIITMVDNSLDNCISINRRHLMTLITDIDSNEEFYYIKMYHMGGDNWDIGFCWLSFLEESVRNSNIKYSKPFFYYDIDTPQKLANVLRTGGIGPTYTPRKMDRTLEAKGSGIYYNNKLDQNTKWPYRFKTRNEFNGTCSKSGDDWRCGPYLFVENMSYLFGRTLEYDFPDNEEYITAYYDDTSWFVTKPMLVKNDIATPSYKPRKMDRTLENVNLINEGENMRDAMNSYYFTHYNSLVITFNKKELNKGKYYEIGQLLEDTTDIPDVSYSFNSAIQHCRTNDFYIAIRLKGVGEEKYLDVALDDMHNLKNNDESTNAKYPKLYTMNDIDSSGKIINILRSGAPEPSYKPRKMDRTLESVDSDKKYLPILIECNTNKDCLEFEYYLHKNGYNYLGGLTYIIRDKFSDLKHVVFFDLNPINKTTNLGGGKPKSYCDNNQETLQYPADISKIDRYLGLRPTYLPKKINRDI